MVDLNQKVKVLTYDLIHNGFQYQDGLNTDTVPFNPSGSCKPGGLYYTTLEFMPNFIGYGTKIANVEIPPESKIYADPEGKKWKSSSVVLSNILPLKDHPCWADQAYCLAAVKQNYRVTIC
jgi:hypothetical protein